MEDYKQNGYSEFTISARKSAIFKRDERTYRGNIVSKRIYRESVKRNILEEVTFQKAEILRSAFAGSQLAKVKFCDTRMRGNAWTSCVFSECEFINVELKRDLSSNFSFSSFYQCKFKNVSFSSSSFIKSQFIDCTFENCRIASSTFEDALFHRCLFSGCEIGATNLEFCEFRTCDFVNTILPLYQICFTIGGMEHVLNLNNSILLRSSKGVYSRVDLYELSDRMQSYYLTLNQYFALANISILKSDLEGAKDYIHEGIDYYLSCRNFRMVKHLCRLGKTNGILTIQQGKEILNLIDNALINYKWNLAEISSYVMHAADLRQLIYDYNGTESILTIEIQTNIKPEEKDKINELINDISSVLDNYENTSHSIQIRHNSPFLIFCSVVGAVAGLFAIAEGVIKLGKFIYKVAKNKDNKNDDDNPPAPTVNYIYNVTGDLVVNGDVNYINNLSNDIQNYSMNDNVVCISNKILTQNGAMISKIERKD